MQSRLSHLAALVCVLSLGTASLIPATTQAQIPPAAVNAALNGPTTTMMLTATAEHTYRHRTRIEKISVNRSADGLVATGKLVNVIKFDTDGVMHFQITCRKGSEPDIQILSVKEPKKWGRTLKTVTRVAKKVIPIVAAAANKAPLVAAAKAPALATAAVKVSPFSRSIRPFDLQVVADGVGSGDEVRQLDQKDWKVPAVALIGAIATQLQASL